MLMVVSEQTKRTGLQIWQIYTPYLSNGYTGNKQLSNTKHTRLTLCPLIGLWMPKICIRPSAKPLKESHHIPLNRMVKYGVAVKWMDSVSWMITFRKYYTENASTLVWSELCPRPCGGLYWLKELSSTQVLRNGLNWIGWNLIVLNVNLSICAEKWKAILWNEEVLACPDFLKSFSSLVVTIPPNCKLNRYSSVSSSKSLTKVLSSTRPREKFLVLYSAPNSIPKSCFSVHW